MTRKTILTKEEHVGITEDMIVDANKVFEASGVDLKKIEKKNFNAEWAYRQERGDVIVHLFAARWPDTFPNILSNSAVSIFKQSLPELSAGFAEELDSWWVLSKNRWSILDPEGLVQMFLQDLDKRWV